MHIYTLSLFKHGKKHSVLHKKKRWRTSLFYKFAVCLQNWRIMLTSSARFIPNYAKNYALYRLTKKCRYHVRVNSNRKHPPRANPGHLFHDESQGTGIWQLIVSRSPGHLQTTTDLFRNILSSFPTALRVKGFKQSFWSRWRAFIDHKRPIKAIEPFALSFFSQSDSFRDLFYAVLLNWNSYVY